MAMTTPIADFVRRYADSGNARFHMPGHKGRAFLGCEALDITEIDGADALYEAAGIIAESEANAAALFGAGRTVYSTEGSSQCIRAMIYLAITEWTARHAARSANTRPLILAGRNAHKSFLYAAALVDAEILWLWPETQEHLCSCPVTPEQLRRTLQNLSVRDADSPPCNTDSSVCNTDFPACHADSVAAVYLTSPDYLGGQVDIAALSAVCREYAVPLLIDNAHGAYLHFLDPPVHPLDLGAALCCDSAHKTLPVLTGGAYLHIAQNAPAGFRERAKNAMALFGSTSPSYLILASLDLCNRYLSDNYPARLMDTLQRLEKLRARLRDHGWQVEKSDPLRLTLRGGTVTDNAVMGGAITGNIITEYLRKGGIAWEYADREYVVLMATPENTPKELDQIAAALANLPFSYRKPPILKESEETKQAKSKTVRGDKKPERILSPRQALFAPSERIPAALSLGRICGAPSVGCPPAIPIAVAGERIDEEAIRLFAEYGVTEVEVLC